MTHHTNDIMLQLCFIYLIFIYFYVTFTFMNERRKNGICDIINYMFESNLIIKKKTTLTMCIVYTLSVYEIGKRFMKVQNKKNS